MMSDNIDDFTWADSPVKRSSGVKQGRRAALPEEDSDGFSGSPLKNRPKTGDVLLLEEEPRRPRASAPARRTGGWGENDRARTAKSILARAGPGAAKDFSDSDEDPVIPDLEEVEQELRQELHILQRQLGGEGDIEIRLPEDGSERQHLRAIVEDQEDFALKVADAPNIAMNRVATYKELDNDLFKHAAFATLEEIDLR